MLFLSFIFCVSQWNAMNLSDYESLSDPLMSAPFEPNSRNIIKMKGTEAIFNFFFYFFIPTVLRGIQSTVIPAKPYTAPLPHGGFLPKSKYYYFLQMASYFCTAMMALSWGGIHLPDVTTSSALFVYSSVMFNKPAPPLHCCHLPLLYVCDGDLTVSLNSLITKKESLQANLRVPGCMNKLRMTAQKTLPFAIFRPGASSAW